MSDGFGPNLLSQVTALDRKLSISKERENFKRNTRQGEHKKHDNSSTDESPGYTPGEAETHHPTGDSPGKIDITI
jgi:hypothetical protein